MNEIGGKKFDDNKIRMDLIPPELFTAVGRVMTHGAQKYGDRNWEKGFRWGRPYAALQRHLNAWWGGESYDPDTGFSHLWHVACNVAFLIYFEMHRRGVDDRPQSSNTTNVSPLLETMPLPPAPSNNTGHILD